MRRRAGHTVNFLRLRRAKMTPPPPNRGNLLVLKNFGRFFGAGKRAPPSAHYPSHLIVRTWKSIRTKGLKTIGAHLGEAIFV